MEQAVKTDLLKVTIDGREILVPKGTLVIEAAKKLGIEIPHFCYHSKLRPDANCRMCLVAVEKMPKLQVACNTLAADGMVVSTQTPPVMEAHKSVLDFILANHPLDCPICDQGGKCDLQNFSHAYTASGGFGETKRVYEKQFFSPLIEKEMNRCITCLRCTRYCDEIIDSKALAAVGRGSQTEIEHFAAHPLDCEFCGGCVQICPVGAFTNRVSLYEFRPWMLKKTDTTCGYCADGCSLTLETRQREVIEVSSFQEMKGRNQGDLCVKGYFGFEFVNSPARLTRPLMRRNGRFVEAPWEEALEFISKKLFELKTDKGGRAIGGLITARCTNEDLYVFQKFMRLALWSNHVDSTARYGHANAAEPLLRAQGTNRWLVSYEDITQARAILLIGSDITETNPIVGIRVKAAVKRGGAKLVAVGPLRKQVGTISNILNLTSQPLSIRFGSERAAVVGLIKAVIEENRVDADTASRFPSYVSAVKQAVSQLSWKTIESHTGLKPEPFKAAAAELFSADRTVALVGPGVTQAEAGYDTMMLLADLMRLTGRLVRPGSGLAPLAEENNELGAIEMGTVPNRLPGLGSVSDSSGRARISRIWKEELPHHEGLTMTAMFEAMKKGEMRGLYIVGEDPVGTLPKSAGVEEALSRAELVVYQGLYFNETAKMAHVILPAVSFAEKNGSFTNHEGRVQSVRLAFDPIGECRPDWEIFTLLAGYLGFPLEYGSEAEIGAEIAKAVPGWKLLPDRALAQSAAEAYASGGFEDGLARRYGIEAGRRPSSIGKGEILLQVGPVLFHSGKMSAQAEALKKIPNADGRLRISPEDAKRLGVTDHEKVRLSADGISVEVPVWVHPKYPEGLAYFPETFAQGVKDLLPMTVDPATGVPYFKQGRVRIEKA
jgi:formate dehydrogenase alpha subunit